MRSRVVRACVVVLFGFAASPVMAQTADTATTPPGEPVRAPVSPMVYADAPVFQYNLDGPRMGVTFMPDVAPRTQFGWHVENQAAPGTRGPWFLVERIFLIGGVEKSEFIPSGTIVFGVRTPGGFEFGIGPSVTLGPRAVTTAVVVAAGQTLRYGGIRVPVNLALAMSHNQRENTNAVRLTLITGWAIRQTESREPRRPYRFGLEK
jgi:hypothetical protein